MTSPPSFPCQALAKFDYNATDDTELSVKANDSLRVEELNDSGWCLASIDGNKYAWVPASFLQFSPVKKSKEKMKTKTSGNEADDEGEGDGQKKHKSAQKGE